MYIHMSEDIKSKYTYTYTYTYVKELMDSDRNDV